MIARPGRCYHRPVPKLAAVSRSLLVLLVGLTSCASLDRWMKSPKGAVVARLASAARFEANPVESDLRVGLCGFRPARTTKALVVGEPEVRLHEEGDHGTGEIDAKLALSVESAHTCAGTLRFGYRYHPAGKHPSYYELFDVARVGEPAAVVLALEQRATKTAIDAPVTAFADGAFVLPDGRVATILTVDVPERGPYTVRFSKPRDGSEPPVLAAYQERRARREGDGTGALGFFVLEKGPAMLVASAPRIEPTEARVVRWAKSP